ncbi:uncharacterized protein LOC129917980 [Episyrphus balteatus]|uniref:uncharacterized protein LOC129917980 n=1 Tax=Episyrphus balteatus TaxID=286459 RepID=UPI002485DF3D|nr:uncharacterized protein LOC129917980 [Episyrphus balteatus]
MGNSISNGRSYGHNNIHRHQEHQGVNKSTGNTNQQTGGGGGESSRVLFLLYLIHRTWNVVIDTVDTRSKRSRVSGRCSTSEDSGAPRSYFDGTSSHDDDDETYLDGYSSLYGSQCTFCSCSYCFEPKQNLYNSIDGKDGAGDCGARRESSICRRMSMCESDLSSFYAGYQMAPSICQNSPLSPGPAAQIHHHHHHPPSASSTSSYKMTNSENSWPQNFTNKENQRPPVYNPEDYIQSLKKFGKRQTGTNAKSIYDPNDVDIAKDTYKSATLPSKYSEYKSPIPSPPETDSEMSLRQFGSITDLLTKLRADLRVSFPSFVQEFVATPLDGVSLLLEVLRAIQLSQTINPTASMTASSSMPRNAQSYQRRALLDELACLQCLSICCCRSPEASARLGTTPVGLLPLAASATGQGIRARIFALQLMTAACDKCLVGHGSHKGTCNGHTAVSEALSTLRLRCSEPVRFRLLVGMLNSGGGSGELQAVGVKFLNTFLESAENLQNRLYLQAELFQAGFEPTQLTKCIESSSPWLEKVRIEVRRFDELKIDIEKLQNQARESDRIRSQMVILERRVQILHEEKSVLTSMERRLQERCAELQREVFRLQGAQSEHFKSLDKQPVALPRLVPPNGKQDFSEHEDEGISSSETGPSLSPVPILVLPQLNSQKFSIMLNEQKEEDATIEDVIEELKNIVSDAEKQISNQDVTISSTDSKPKVLEAKEKEIVPVNLLPQPPRKSRSLAHIMSNGGESASDLDGSEYGLLLLQNQNTANLDPNSYFEEPADYEGKPYQSDRSPTSARMHPSTNREILDVIMNARHTDDDPTMKAFREGGGRNSSHTSLPVVNQTEVTVPPPAQHFNGVFFMTGMNTPQKYPRPDVTAALEARRVTKNLERIEGTTTANEIICEKSRSNQQIFFGSSPTLKINTGLCMANVSVVNNVNTRTRSYTHGSKVTDIPSGLY